MKIRHSLKGLYPTVQFGNVTLEAEIQADLNDLEDRGRMDSFAACNGITGGYTAVLRAMVLQEVLEQKAAIESALEISDFQLNV